MFDHQANEQQKVDLYLKHYDAITEVTQTFEDHREDFTTEWPVRLEERLLENGWTDLDQWTFRAKDSDWAHLFERG